MATTAELLQEAKDAYHRLSIGEAVVEVRDASGETIRYAQIRAPSLLAYIRTLDPAFMRETSSCRPLRFVG